MVSSFEFFAEWKHALSDDFASLDTPRVPAKWGGGRDGPLTWDTESSHAVFDAEIHDVVLSPCSSLLAVAVGDLVHLLDATTLARRRTVGGRSGEIRRLDWSPDGKYLAVESHMEVEGDRRRNLFVTVWNLEEDVRTAADDVTVSLESAARTSTDHAVDALVSSQVWARDEVDRDVLEKDLRRALDAAHVRLVLARQGAVEGQLGGFGSSSFSTDSRRLLYIVTPSDPTSRKRAFGPSRTSVVVLALAAREPVFELVGHTDAIMWVSESPSGTLIATSSWDHTVRLWSAVDGTPSLVLQTHQQSWAGAFSPDSSLVAAGSGEGAVWVWDTRTGETKHRLEGFKRWIRSIAFHPIDGRTVALGAGGGTFRLVELPSEKCLQHWQIDVKSHIHASGFLEVCNVQFSADGERVLLTTTDGRVTIYDQGQNVKWELEQDVTRWKEGHWGAGGIISKDGKVVCCAGRDGAVRRWAL